MNRVIRFRAKELHSGKWLYGGLAKDKYGIYVILPEKNWQKGGCVSQNTIGQFTGFYDKNGKEIYEGDIVSIEFRKDVTRGIVAWNEYQGSWCIHLKGECIIGFTPIGEMILRYDMRIIGNIYDNPELIKEDNNEIANNKEAPKKD